mgnify:CR=1 FL=1
MFGAVRDTFAGKNTILAHYIENVVGIERDEYVNSGVLLMNLDKIRQAHLADRFLKLWLNITLTVLHLTRIILMLCVQKKYIFLIRNGMLCLTRAGSI